MIVSYARDIMVPLAGKPPNIVFILADDLGYADVSCYGRPDLNTPNIDRNAKRECLSAWHANSAVCSATRTALITGRYQYRLRLGLEEPPQVTLMWPAPEHPTLPSLLRRPVIARRWWANGIGRSAKVCL